MILANAPLLSVRRAMNMIMHSRHPNGLRFYSTATSKSVSDIIQRPHFIAGFLDGDGSFRLDIRKITTFRAEVLLPLLRSCLKI